jgi:sarcosine oxidase
MPPTVDVIVVGLGAHGSATAYQLARRGARVLGIDRFAPPHDRGSSHGATRITRLAIGEGDVYVPLVRRSHEIWRELESAGGTELLVRTGGLVLGRRSGAPGMHGQPDFVASTIAVARRHAIAHEVLDAAGIAARFPQFDLRGDETAYYEPESGVLRPEACIQANLDAARRHGAELRTDEPVLALESDGAGAAVRTARGRFAAAHVVVTAGAWLPGLVGGPFATHLRVMRQALYWFEPSEPARWSPPAFPIFIWQRGALEEDDIYGFPMVDGHGGVKIGDEQLEHTTDPDALDRVVSAAEQRRMFERNVARRFRGLTDACVHSAACLYTVSPDSGFLVDRHPVLDHVTVVSACSGHGFKHSAGLGEAVAQRVLGETTGFDLSPFSLARLGN